MVQFETFFEDRDNVYIMLEICTNQVRTVGKAPIFVCGYSFSLMLSARTLVRHCWRW